jgi:hypothetical protein
VEVPAALIKRIGNLSNVNRYVVQAVEEKLDRDHVRAAAALLHFDHRADFPLSSNGFMLGVLVILRLRDCATLFDVDLICQVVSVLEHFELLRYEDKLSTKGNALPRAFAGLRSRRATLERKGWISREGDGQHWHITEDAIALADAFLAERQTTYGDIQAFLGKLNTFEKWMEHWGVHPGQQSLRQFARLRPACTPEELVGPALFSRAVSQAQPTRVSPDKILKKFLDGRFELDGRMPGFLGIDDIITRTWEITKTERLTARDPFGPRLTKKGEAELKAYMEITGLTVDRWAWIIQAASKTV